jgi:hypothetical protein
LLLMEEMMVECDERKKRVRGYLGSLRHYIHLSIPPNPTSLLPHYQAYLGRFGHARHLVSSRESHADSK